MIAKGDMVLCANTTDITLRDVLHVPEIGSNLLSIAKIIDHSHKILFSPIGCQIMNAEGIRVQEVSCKGSTTV